MLLVLILTYGKEKKKKRYINFRYKYGDYIFCFLPFIVKNEILFNVNVYVFITMMLFYS